MIANRRDIQNRQIFSDTEFTALESNIALLIESLSDATHENRDPPDSTDLQWSTRLVRNGPGAPSVKIDRAILTEIVHGNHKWTDWAPLLKCHPRTIRRLALSEGLVEPGQAVYSTQLNDDGSTYRHYNRQGPRSRTSGLTDNELDLAITDILNMHPRYGRVMVKGQLASMGQHVPLERVRESYVRVRGPPRPFGYRQVHRQPYNVPGANSLWHHDGQHGMPSIQSPIFQSAND